MKVNFDLYLLDIVIPFYIVRVVNIKIYGKMYQLNRNFETLNLFFLFIIKQFKLIKNKIKVN